MYLHNIFTILYNITISQVSYISVVHKLFILFRIVRRLYFLLSPIYQKCHDYMWYTGVIKQF